MKCIPPPPPPSTESIACVSSFLAGRIAGWCRSHSPGQLQVKQIAMEECKPHHTPRQLVQRQLLPAGVQVGRNLRDNEGLTENERKFRPAANLQFHTWRAYFPGAAGSKQPSLALKISWLICKNHSARREGKNG
jgi:hypothetical protein